MEIDLQQARGELRQIADRSKTEALGPLLSRMLHVIESMNATLDPDLLFPMAIRQIVEIFEAERGFLILGWDSMSMQFQAAVSFDGREIEQPRKEVSRAVIQEVADTRQAIVVENARADSRFESAESVHDLRLYSVLCVPLIAEGELLGVAYLDNRGLPGAFNEQDRDLLVLFAGQAAVAMRNAQLFEELKQTRRKLLQAERLQALGQLAASVAHEVRTPISALKLMAGEAEDRLDDPGFRALFLETIRDESNRINGIVSGLLDYARPSTLQLVDLDVQDILDSCASLLNGARAEAGVVLSKDYVTNLPQIVADGEKLKQVFCNLIQNAMDAVAHSERKRVTLTTTVHGPDQVAVKVSDTGPGVHEDAEDSVFDPFFTTKEDGTGLGLAISAKIVSEHGGAIDVKSPPGQGATFTVALPMTGPGREMTHGS
ncbi:GAF domain-containing protein [PVC group bacterium]|nr:GAF domain-containing protein [PVC group bacterium]